MENATFSDKSTERLRKLLEDIKSDPAAYGVPTKGESRPAMGIPPGIGVPKREGTKKKLVGGRSQPSLMNSITRLERSVNELGQVVIQNPGFA